MTQPLDPDDALPPLDVRSPGERWADSGRAGVDRVHEWLEPERVAVAALVWMLALAVILGVTIWGAWHFSTQSYLGSDGPGESATWIKLSLLSQTGSMTLTVAVLAGLGLVALGRSAQSRAAAYLAVVIGAWTVLAGALGIIVAFHRSGIVISNPYDNRLALGLGAAASGALGAVITAVAAALSRSASEPVVS